MDKQKKRIVLNIFYILMRRETALTQGDREPQT